MHPPANQLPALSLPPERAPFSSFWARLAAFAIDCGALYLGARLLDRGARLALLELNPWLPYAGHLLAFLYFWIGNGPLTGGRTLGKLVMSLQTVGADGHPLGWKAAARRAAIQQFVFFIHDPERFAMGFPPSLAYGALMGFILLGTASLVESIVLAALVGFHPHKQGWHDLWAGSFVTAAPLPPAFTQTLVAPADFFAGHRRTAMLRLSLVFWVLATATLLIQPIQIYLQPQLRAVAHTLVRLNEELPLRPYVLVERDFPSAPVRRDFLEAAARVRESARIAGEAVPTTDSLRARVLDRGGSDGETIVALLYRERGVWSPQDLQEPGLREAVSRLRAQLWREWRAQPPAAADHATSAPLVARQFSAQLIEPFLLFLHNGSMPRARVHGPADPAAGALVFEPIAPEAEDRPAQR